MPRRDLINILLVEDNRDITDNIVFYLQRQGHIVDTCYLAQQALSLLQQQQYDMLVFDIMLPGMDGFTLAKQVRNLKIATPIIFLTARGALEDKREGFNLGGDDYITKPFELEELELRIISVYRRAKGMIDDTLTLGQWSLNENLKEIKYQQQSIVTTHIGFTIFKALMISHPNILSRRELEKKLWRDTPPNSDALRSHIFSLRKAIARVYKEPVVETVHGVGFRFIDNTRKG